jgi:8-oxo-dGTP pyrophosphatase MutT (NUDIX family)
MRKLFKISTKAALFNKTKDKILVIHMERNNDFGLPGGHIDEDETPDEAIKRELIEECGIKCDNLRRKDFFMHSDGKLILAYVGQIDNETLKSAQNNVEEVPKWLSKNEFINIYSIESVYRNLVLDNWPE